VPPPVCRGARPRLRPPRAAPGARKRGGRAAVRGRGHGPPARARTGPDHILVRSDRRPPTLGHQLPPLEQQAWRDAM
jgi:hypothetical protein